VHAADLLSRNIRRRAGQKPVFDNWKETALLAWTGMRGVVSLAAALSLPLALTSGAPFYGRDLIIFITFSVILVTLLLQGVSLPYLIKALNKEKINALQNLLPDSSSTGALPAQVRLAVLTAERQQAIHIRGRGEIDDELLHALEHELDLEEARLRQYP
jgi:CPA1 family monovalent cation:H+ antiporter